MMTTRRTTVLVPAMLILGLFAFACGDDGATGPRSEVAASDAGVTPPAVSYDSVLADDVATGQEVTVLAEMRTFSPPLLSVSAGSATTLTLQNLSHETHTLTVYVGADPGGEVVADTGEVMAGEMGQAEVFLTSGRHAFRCEIHPEMQGAIVVQ